MFAFPIPFQTGSPSSFPPRHSRTSFLPGFSHLETNKHVTDILRLIVQWSDVMMSAPGNHEPSTILIYLFQLAHQLSSSYDVVKAVNAVEGSEITCARAALFEATRQVLYNAMCLLGSSPMERYVFRVFILTLIYVEFDVPACSE